MERPLYRMCYKHVAGKVFYCIGTAVNFKQKEEEVVILSDISNGEILYTPLATFWDKHPETKAPRFELVKPS